MTNMKKGFTLVELLVVIGILAVLATATVLILNPAEYLKQSRDSNRISDLGAVQSALALLAADGTPANQWFGEGLCKSTVTPAVATDRPVATACTVATSVRTPGASGWVNARLDSFTNNPLKILPMDPTNSPGATGVAAYYYAYIGGTVAAAPSQSIDYKLGTKLESLKYIPMMTNANDGGTSATWYETGSKLDM